MAEWQSSNIFLIGYRGSGKTTVGRLLAEHLAWRFVDTDRLIELDAGITIAEIFASQGEAGFRRHEAEAIVRVTENRRQVVSIGGGAVVNRRNVERIRRSGIVVWLTAPADVLWERINRDARSKHTRPDLTEHGGLEEVRRVLAARQPAYASAADRTIPTENRSLQNVVEVIAALLADAEQE